MVNVVEIVEQIILMMDVHVEEHLCLIRKNLMEEEQEQDLNAKKIGN